MHRLIPRLHPFACNIFFSFFERATNYITIINHTLPIKSLHSSIQPNHRSFYLVSIDHYFNSTTSLICLTTTWIWFYIRDCIECTQCIDL
eukprot:UN07911